MCLAVPGKIIEAEERDGSRIAKVKFGGIARQVFLNFVPEAQVGDYVMVHVGFAISRVDAPEQPFAEGFIYNAVRKTMDQGQLELVKSGNRQPVPLTTRYYSAKQKKFVFNDTSEQQRKDFLAGKLYWLSGVLGAGEPVWLLDPRDAQYLDTTLDELRAPAGRVMGAGVLRLGPGAGGGSPPARGRGGPGGD